MRVREVAVEASSSRLEVVQRSTTKGEDIVVGTTIGGPTTEGVGSMIPDTPSF